MSSSDLDTKIARFQALKAQHPTLEMPRWTLATALAEAGRPEDAIAELRELVALKPDYCVAFLHLGELLVEQERFEEAVAPLERAAALAVEQHHSAPRLRAETLLGRAREELE
jgi:predicted Zn-dependent protease